MGKLFHNFFANRGKNRFFWQNIHLWSPVMKIKLIEFLDNSSGKLSGSSMSSEILGPHIPFCQDSINSLSDP